MAPSATLPLVQLIGSIPLDSNDDVFAKLGQELPGRLRRMPDGETGVRKDFCGWQYVKMPTKVLKPEINPAASGDYDQTNKSSAAPAAAKLTLDDFPPTDYDTVALESYAKFKKLRDDGKIKAGTRFQVCLPTPLNSMAFFVDNAYVDAAEPLYEQRILEALANVQKSIPKDDLAIQWDMCVEMCHMEHGYGPKRDSFVAMTPHYSPVLEGILKRNSPLLAAVDPAVPMGIHLCYGDYGHQHFVEPEDTALLVQLANGLQSQLPPGRVLNWVHLPVPKGRTDAPYFEPLKKLTTDPATSDLVLGLVHANDLAGTQARVAAAAAVLGDGRRFGVSTECGMGRTPREELDSILSICREVTPAP